MKKSLRIISLIKKGNDRYLKKTHQFGIELPKSVAQTYALYKKNGNTFWTDTTAKRMKDMSPAFKTLYNWEIVPIGYQRVNVHMVFDIDMKYFRRKATDGASIHHNVCNHIFKGDSEDCSDVGKPE